MNSRDFAFWLQGIFELGEVTSFNEKQTEMIRRHLSLVFIHEIDPSMSADPEVQAKLNEAHDGSSPAVVPAPVYVPKPTPWGRKDPTARC